MQLFHDSFITAQRTYVCLSFIYIYVCVCVCVCWCTEFIKTKFPGESDSTVRKAISAKCNDEDKCCARKSKKRSAVDAVLPADMPNMDDDDVASD